MVTKESLKLSCKTDRMTPISVTLKGRDIVFFCHAVIMAIIYFN